MENWALFPVILVGLFFIAVLVLAANLSVTKLVGIAAYFNLSSTFMGMTVVSLATSIPEITSHLTASFNILAGKLDFQIGSAIVLGSNIGSDVVQQTFILGLVVLLSEGLYFRRYFHRHVHPAWFGRHLFPVGWLHPVWQFCSVQFVPLL
jgi:cation:H+ antiporter